MNEVGPFNAISDALPQLLAQRLHSLKRRRLALLEFDGGLAKCLVSQRVEDLCLVLKRLFYVFFVFYFRLGRRCLNGD